MKRAPWFYMEADFQDDDKLLMVSAEAELLYVRSIGRAKKAKRQGVVPRALLRRLCDKMATPPAELEAELQGVGLWSTTPDGAIVVVAYVSWNGLADNAATAKAEGGRRGNHTRWEHPGSYADCPVCHPELAGQSHTDSHSDSDTDSAPTTTPDTPPPYTEGVSPGESHTDRIPIAVRVASDAGSVSPDHSHTDRIQNNTIRVNTPPTPPGLTEPTPEGAGPAGVLTDGDEGENAPEIVELADRMVAKVTSDPTAVADEWDRKLVVRCIARGWTPAQLYDLAVQASARADNPRAWLTTCLEMRADGRRPLDGLPRQPPAPPPPGEDGWPVLPPPRAAGATGAELAKAARANLRPGRRAT